MNPNPIFQALDDLFPPSPLPPPSARQQLCAAITAQYKRAQASKTFKTWGTPEQIAANHRAFVMKSPEAPAVFFPCPPTPESQSSSVYLE